MRSSEARADLSRSGRPPCPQPGTPRGSPPGLDTAVSSPHNLARGHENTEKRTGGTAREQFMNPPQLNKKEPVKGLAGEEQGEERWPLQQAQDLSVLDRRLPTVKDTAHVPRHQRKGPRPASGFPTLIAQATCAGRDPWVEYRQAPLCSALRYRQPRPGRIASRFTNRIKMAAVLVDPSLPAGTVTLSKLQSLRRLLCPGASQVWRAQSLRLSCLSWLIPADWPLDSPKADFSGQQTTAPTDHRRMVRP
ncbi:hypothetical protein AAFF_G00207660 [Aldrovandia affinis]|uniref:Uncharacterized protein n=1 Tax=Aldrovandia affinis TaxID=143900 RepID=A0AAD7RH43_9TELE|nr:hypothetical protein AAFF_G00207660 [Aldrovandia affinis]